MVDSSITGTKGRPPLWRAALFGLCPECGSPGLYDGALRISPKCHACGLDFDQFNVGDGPAALLVLVVGAIVTPAALALHFKVNPPLWVHLLLWPVIVTGLTVGGLRVSKAALLAAEHQREGREGKLDDDQGTSA